MLVNLVLAPFLAELLGQIRTNNQPWRFSTYFGGPNTSADMVIRQMHLLVRVA